MFDTIFLQTEIGAALIIAILVAIIISAIFYGMQRKSISSIKDRLALLSQIDPKIQYDVSKMQTDLQNVNSDLVNLRTGLPHTTEIASMQENVNKLCEDFTEMKENLDDQMNKFKLVTTQDLNKTQDLMLQTAQEKLIEHAKNHLTENSVSRDEFERLKDRIEKMLGADEVAERMEVLATLFDPSDIKRLNWQCKLTKLLIGGLAPDAEEDLIIAEGIPVTSGEKFLKNLTSAGITEIRKVSAFYLLPEYEWIYSYIENPDWLQKRLEGTAKKEKEYQQYIKNNLNLVEEGLLLEHAEYSLATGRIDFICRDKNGKTVGLELKYPTASRTVKRQILGYKNDYEQKTGKTDSRFIIVAPKIPEYVKTLLTSDGFEYREIDF